MNKSDGNVAFVLPTSFKSPARRWFFAFFRG